MQVHAKRKVINRLHRIQGHLKKVEEMVKKDIYCIDILRQSLAVRRALEEAEAEILDSHFHTCVTEAVRGKKEKREKAILELLNLFREKR
ncbi:MAG: hypothetical protein LiPW16_240 [Microgenomates group bacterium LiPW_16]|nr:MAG: hypothetical protein LiPW16_240 [Microgenomates group bacterium LiPW_16]